MNKNVMVRTVDGNEEQYWTGTYYETDQELIDAIANSYMVKLNRVPKLQDQPGEVIHFRSDNIISVYFN